jgi:ribosomal protein L16 Arg81 hydroxylase
MSKAWNSGRVDSVSESWFRERVVLSAFSHELNARERLTHEELDEIRKGRGVGRLEAAARLGATCQVLQPQVVTPPLARVLSDLESAFSCLVGCNAYLTPPGTQGLAPHYDSISAFVVQLEGEKRWRLHETPRQLARFYSPDFEWDWNQEPSPFPLVAEIVLRPGDLLYFPRGVVHHAAAVGDKLSHHITISTHERRTFLDLLEHAVPQALLRANAGCIDLRQGLPPHAGRVAGEAYAAKPTRATEGPYTSALDDTITRRSFNEELAAAPTGSARRDLLEGLRNRWMALLDYVDVDEAMDMMADEFLVKRLPPLRALRSRVDWEAKGLTSVYHDWTGYSIQLVHAEYVRLLLEPQQEAATRRAQGESDEEEGSFDDESSADESDESDSDVVPTLVTADGRPHTEVMSDDDDDSEDEDDSDEDSNALPFGLRAPDLVLAWCWDNNAKAHMDAREEPEAPRCLFPLHFGPALRRLLAYPQTPVRLSELPGLEEEEAFGLASQLASCGFLEKAVPPQQTKKRGGGGGGGRGRGGGKAKRRR